jgi:pimeloyl-ACP methyl ester carboxylesterase
MSFQELLQRMIGTTLAAWLLVGCAAPTPTPTPVPPTTKPTTIPPTVTPTPQPSPTYAMQPSFTPSPTSTPDFPLESVTFTTEDDIIIAGTLFGEGELAVLLLHMGLGRTDQKSWHPFARLLAEAGYTALAIDFRGRGASGGTASGGLAPDRLIKDARAAVEFLRARGYNRLVCMGASMGGTTCLRLSMEVELEGVVVIASTMRLGEVNKVTNEDLSQSTIPKLFIYGSRDSPQVVLDMSSMVRAAQQPKEEIVYDSASHGTDLFRGPYGDNLRQHLLNFLNELR